MRTGDLMSVFDASGLDERYRVLAVMALQGDAMARELLLDAISARELRLRGVESLSDYEKRRGFRARIDALYRETETKGQTAT